MTALRNKVIEQVAQAVRVVFVDRTTAKWWNERRKKDDTCMFCGWYWVRGDEELGPFRTRSACVRDAYYRLVLKREMPAVGQSLAYPKGMPRLRRKARS